MKIVIAGGTGFLGAPLVRSLLGRGDSVAVLSRNPGQVRVGRGVAWDAKTQGGWAAEVAAADAIVNLAGENIGEGRWTPERKNRLVGSRLEATAALVEALRRAPAGNRTLINASAIGLYGSRGDETLDETSPRGDGFLADLVENWETAARQTETLARLVILRFGVVLAKDGGALGKMLLPFRLGVGGPIGSGEQWMSWVDRDDVIRFILWALDDDSVRGVYNVTAPEPVRNRDFGKALGRALHRPAVMPTPAFALRLLFGEMADEVLLAGQKVLPARAGGAFRFEHPSLDETLERHLRR